MSKTRARLIASSSRSGRNCLRHKRLAITGSPATRVALGGRRDTSTYLHTSGRLRRRQITLYREGSKLGEDFHKRLRLFLPNRSRSGQRGPENRGSLQLGVLSSDRDSLEILYLIRQTEKHRKIEPMSTPVLGAGALTSGHAGDRRHGLLVKL